MDRRLPSHSDLNYSGGLMFNHSPTTLTSDSSTALFTFQGAKGGWYICGRHGSQITLPFRSELLRRPDVQPQPHHTHQRQLHGPIHVSRREGWMVYLWAAWIADYPPIQI